MATYDDPRILRAIAHPARNRILSELFAGGSLRAADIARELGIPANQASFHLRQLAKYGLVEEAPEEARDKRDRVWRLAAEDGITIRSEDLRARGGEAAVELLRRNGRARGHLLVEQAMTDEPEGVKRTVSEYSLRLTSEEVVELTDEIGALIDRWRTRTRGRADDRTTYSVYQLVQPYPELPQGEDPVKDDFRVVGFQASGGPADPD